MLCSWSLERKAGALAALQELEGSSSADLTLSMILREMRSGDEDSAKSHSVGFFLFIKVIHDKKSCQISGPRKKIARRVRWSPRPQGEGGNGKMGI